MALLRSPTFALRRFFIPAVIVPLLAALPGAVRAEGPLPVPTPAATHLHLPRVALVEPLRPEGTYAVEVFSAGAWETLGSVPADKHYRTGSLPLPAGLANGPLRVRVTARGGNHAHLDSVLLGAVPPLSVNGAALHKLVRRDHDVADVTGRTVELEFPRLAAAYRARPLALHLTGRIEPVAISTTPFQFPLANMHRPITPQGAFYSYRLGERPGRLTVDGDLTGEALGAPFFHAYYPVGSGHPQAPTLGWVRDDGETLYVAIDVVGDNTVDPGGDYTKVFVNTPEGVRMFRVTTGEERWGRSGFQYTPRVTWEHKVYEFAIPLAELGLDSLRSAGQTLQLAFAAYGTFSPGDYDPAVAYSAACNGFALVYAVATGATTESIELDLLNAAGQALLSDQAIAGPAASVQRSSPRIAYDFNANHYLVVWSDDRNSGTTGFDIFGQLVDGDGTLIGSAIEISTGASDQRDPAIAYDPLNQRFLVAWEDSRNSGSTSADIWGQIVNADGTLSGGNFVIFVDSPAALVNQLDPAVAFNPSSSRYLVVWIDVNTTNIHGRQVNAAGTPLGTAVEIGGASNSQVEPDVAYEPVNDRYLVVWSDWRAGGSSSAAIWGQLINSNGTLFDQDGNLTPDSVLDNIQVSSSSLGSFEPAIAFDPINSRFVVAWSRSISFDSQIERALVTPAGAPAGTDVFIAQTTDGEFTPTLAANLTDGGYLAAWEVFGAGDTVIGTTTASLAPFSGGGSGKGLPPWGVPLLAAAGLAWLVTALGTRWRPRLRPAFHAATLALALSLAAAGIAACSDDDPAPPAASEETPTCPS